MINFIRSIECGVQLEIVKSDGIELLKDKRAAAFLNEWCLLFGSTYEGRRRACAIRMGIKQKVPILISENTKDMMFPTCNVRSFACIWINHRALEKSKGTAHWSQLFFLDGSILEISCDIRIIRRELAICEEYLHIIDSSPMLFHDIISTSEE